MLSRWLSLFFNYNLYFKDPEKLFVTCDICNKQVLARSLTGHKRYVHRIGKLHTCDFCGKEYADNRKLEVHIRENHTHEKPFECEKCGKAFSGADYLSQHAKRCKK